MGLLDRLGLFRITYTKDPEEAAALGYVNPGDDRRVAGELGAVFGGIQHDLSFKRAERPNKTVKRYGSTVVETAIWPDGKQHMSIAFYRGEGLWATIRFGYRVDENWGDERTIGYNPYPEVIGGAI